MTYSLKKWTLPDYYSGNSWADYYVFLGRNRDSDDLTESNFHSALSELGGESETVLIVRESHWACGWIEWIAIHESDKSSIRKARDICDSLNDYPVLNEDDWIEREDETAQQIWRECYNSSDRIEYIRKYRDQFNFSSMADLMGCARGQYFCGYASELIG